MEVLGCELALCPQRIYFCGKNIRIPSVMSAAPGILPSSQPPMPCSEKGAGNAALSTGMAEESVGVWSHEGLVLTKLLGGADSVWFSVAASGLLPDSVPGLCGLRLCASARAGSPAGLESGPEGSGLVPALFSGVG